MHPWLLYGHIKLSISIARTIVKNIFHPSFIQYQLVQNER